MTTPTIPPGPPTTPANANQQKCDTILAFLATGGNVDLFLDARLAFVGVPHHLRTQYGLQLVIGYNTNIPIHDLVVDIGGISATLAFGGQRCQCFVPWEALWMAACPVGRVLWPASVPAEVRLAAVPAPAPPRPHDLITNVVSLDSFRTPRDYAEVAARRMNLTALGAPGSDGAA